MIMFLRYKYVCYKVCFSVRKQQSIKGSTNYFKHWDLPEMGMFCETDNCTSPVPGGMSTTK